MNPIGVYVPVYEVFPDTESEFSTFKSLLTGLSLTDTLFWCARLNLVVSNPLVDHRAKQQYGLNEFFNSEEIKRVNEFVRQHGGSENIAVFFRGQLLELIRWACLFCQDHPNDGETFRDPEVRRTFAKAALIASDVWAKRIKLEDRLSLEGGIEAARKRGLGPIRQALSDNSSGIDPFMALGRGRAIFCEYLPQFYPGLEQEFCAKAGLSLEEYFICLCSVISSCLNRIPEKAAQDTKYSGIFHMHTFCKPAPHMEPIFSSYFALESQTIDELREALWGKSTPDSQEEITQYDYRILRQRPILRVSDGRAIILDPVFYAERASVGPLFLMTAGESRGKANEIFGAFGRAFESYAGDILRRMYPDPGSALVNRLTNDLKGTDSRKNEIQIADACLNDITEVVLFEMKAAWIRDDAILDDDPERYLANLRERYGVSEKKGERPKGVAQLANAISKVAKGEWAPSGQDFKAAHRIYPVLLVHDALLDAPVHTHILASDFKEALEPDEILQTGDMKKGPFRVTPLIIVTIRDLENLETSVEGFSLRALLQDYSSSCRDRLESLHNFVAESVKYKTQLRYSRSVASKSLEILNRTVETVFPDKGARSQE